MQAQGTEKGYRAREKKVVEQRKKKVIGGIGHVLCSIIDAQTGKTTRKECATCQITIYRII